MAQARQKQYKDNEVKAREASEQLGVWGRCSLFTRLHWFKM